jgi:hypothetical protein
VTTLRPDVVLLDTGAPGNGAVAVIRTVILKRLPTAFVGLVGELDVESILLNQLDALILKSDPLREMASTILAVASKGKYSPSRRETDPKPPFVAPRRQYPKLECHKGLLSSSIPHQRGETPLRDQTTPPDPPKESGTADPKPQNMEPVPPTREAESYCPAEKTILPPTWEKTINGSDNGNNANTALGGEDIQATNLDDKATLHKQLPHWRSSGRPSLLESVKIELSEASKPKTEVCKLETEAAKTETEASKADTEVAKTEEVVAQGAEPVALEPVQEPSAAAHQPDNGVESTLKEVLPSAGSIVLIASPFANFRSLGNFQQVLEGLEGVRSMRVRRFQGGTLYAVIRYTGTAEQFEEQLKDLAQFDIRIVDSKPGAIEIRINPSEEPSDE